MKISNKIKIVLAALAFASGFIFATTPTFAATQELKCPSGYEYDSNKHLCMMVKTNDDTMWGDVSTIMNWMFVLVGIVSVPLTVAGIVLTVIGAKKQSKMKENKKDKTTDGKKKKKGMLIAGIIMLCVGVVGFVVALLGAAIVNFALDATFAGV